MKRERKGWYTEQRRGRWFAVDRASGRRVKAHGREHAVNLVRENNEREVCGVARTPAALVWG